MTTIKLNDQTGISSVSTAWVAGFNGGGSTNGLKATGGGAGSFSGATQPFYPIGSGDGQIDTITLSGGGGRLIFIVSQNQPTTLPIGQGSFTPAPYPTAPSTLPAGPQDFFEFSYNGNDDLTAVQGFGLNMYFTLSGTNEESYGANQYARRDAIGWAYLTFMHSDPEGAAYQKLLYPSASYQLPSGMSVPLNQYFAICDPFDWITNYPTDGLATYWDSTLSLFFQDNNYLSIDLGNANIYSGQCSGGTYTLSNGTNTYAFSDPGSGLSGAQYVFGQAFAGGPPAADQGLLQDNIWQALCRGVALDGVSFKSITNGETTTAWNNYSKWYTQHTSNAFPTFAAVYDTYAKFLHYSTVMGTDSRFDSAGYPPLFLNNAAYGFSEDENPNGNYTGGQVPSKTIALVGPDDTIQITLGPWKTIWMKET